MENTLNPQIASTQKTKLMTRIAVLTALGAVLYRLEIPFMVAHLKIDPSVIPSLVGGLMMGPVAGVTIELLKNISHLFVSSTLGVGELINFIVGSSLVVPISLIYRKNSNKKNFIIGAVASLIVTLIIGAICNYLLTPVFYAVMNLPDPTHAEIMGFVMASFGLNSFKTFVTVAPTFFMLNMIEQNKF